MGQITVVNESIMDNAFVKLAAIDVNKHVEKKNGFSYLSWAWAVDQLMRQDPAATWAYLEPVKWGDTVMVFCTVTAFGKAMTAQLPVIDHRNKPIPNPDAFQVNTAMQRCLAKAIALHGLGLYLYAGEDLPLEASDDAAKPSNGLKTQGNAVPEAPSEHIKPQTMSELAVLALDPVHGPKIDKVLADKQLSSIEKLTEEQATKLINWLTKPATK